MKQRARVGVELLGPDDAAAIGHGVHNLGHPGGDRSQQFRGVFSHGSQSSCTIPSTMLLGILREMPRVVGWGGIAVAGCCGRFALLRCSRSAAARAGSRAASGRAGGCIVAVGGTASLTRYSECGPTSPNRVTLRNSGLALRDRAQGIIHRTQLRRACLTPMP